MLRPLILALIHALALKHRRVHRHGSCSWIRSTCVHHVCTSYFEVEAYCSLSY